jgi:hypothetical protein
MNRGLRRKMILNKYKLIMRFVYSRESRLVFSDQVFLMTLIRNLHMNKRLHEMIWFLEISVERWKRG